MGFDMAGGVLVVLGIAFLTLAAIFLARKLFKKSPPDEGINESRELRPHEPHHVGSDVGSDGDNRRTRV